MSWKQPDPIISDYHGRIVKQGYLTKEGRRIKTWKRRFFIIRNGQLEYYTKALNVQQGLVDVAHYKGAVILARSFVKYIGNVDSNTNNSTNTTDDSGYDSGDDLATMIGGANNAEIETAKTKKNDLMSAYVYKFIVYDEITNRALVMAARTAQEAKEWVQVISNCIHIENYIAAAELENTRPLLQVLQLLNRGRDAQYQTEATLAAMEQSIIIPASHQNVYEISTSHVDATMLELVKIQPFTLHSMNTMIDFVLYNKSLSTLNTLRITHCELNDDFMIPLSEALSINMNIRTLDLSHNRIGNKGCGLLCDGLLINTSLTHLDMSNNEFGDAGVVYISDLLMSNISLAHLNLSRNSISTDGILALSKALQSNTTLIHLNLSYSNVNEAAAEHLSTGLKNNKTLLTLGIANCNITSAGMDSLCYGCLVNKSLKELDLRGNLFDKEGAFALVTALKDHKSLVRVDIGENSQMGSDGITVLAQALKSKFLISKLVMTRKK